MVPPTGTAADAAAIAAAAEPLWRDPLTVALVAACGGGECHLVGGVLRDLALGVAAHDLDAVVAGSGLEIAERLAVALPARLVRLGREDHAAYRLVLLRAVAGPAGLTRFATLDLWDRGTASLHDDLARRDFTINALALDARGGGGLLDPCGGLADLRRGMLRATTPRSFEDDPVRVLRLARFAVQLAGFAADPATFELARRAAPLLQSVAADRIREELRLLLALAANAEVARGLRALAALGLYPALWLGAPPPAGPAIAPAAARAGISPAHAEPAADMAPVDATADMALVDATADMAPVDAAATAGRTPLDFAAAELTALPGCAAELEHLLAAAQADAATTAAWDPIDLPTARLAATFRYLPAPAGWSGGAGSGGAIGGAAAGPPIRRSQRRAAPATAAATILLSGMVEAGYLAARRAAMAEPLLAAPQQLPATEIEQRRFLNRHGRRWLTAVCSAGASAAVAAGAATAVPSDTPAAMAAAAATAAPAATATDPTPRQRWRGAAEAICELAWREGAALLAPPHLLDGEDVQRLLDLSPGPGVGSALEALGEAQIDGVVRTRDEAERFLRDWQAARPAGGG
jgi:hypothetical protein